MKDPDWDGPMTGTMRGRPLVWCRKHGGWWTVDRRCPACRLEEENARLLAQLEGKK